MPTDGGLPLASPWIRLGAALIDGLILAVPNWLIGKFLFGMPSTQEIMDAAGKGQEALDKLMPGTGTMILAQVVGLALFLGVNFTFLKKGQTIGKMALKLQVQNRQTGALLSLQDIILKRILPVYGVAALSNSVFQFIGILIIVDALLIFRKDRNTLHDDIAQTKVVKLPG